MATQPENTDQMQAFLDEAPVDVGLSDDDFAVLMGQQEKAPESDPTPAPVEGEPPAATPDPVTPPADTPPVDPPAPSTEELLRQQITALTAQMSELQAKIAAPSAPQAPVQQPQQPTADEPAVPNYLYAIPDPLMDAIESDDRKTRAQALSHLMSQIAQRVHFTLRKETETALETRFQSYDTTLSARQQQAEIRKDYFDNFSSHNKPEIQPLIAMISQQVLAEMKTTAWTPAVRNAVGARVNALLGNAQGTGQPPVTSSSPTPPPLVTSTGRPGTPPQMTSQERMISETFD